MSVDKNSSYYDAGGIETLAIIKAKLTPEQFAGFLLGNVIKYSTRANFKGTALRDIDKAGVYSNQLKQLMLENSAPLPDVQTVGDTTVVHGTIAPDDTQSSNGSQPIPDNVVSIPLTPRAKHEAQIDGDQLA